MTITKEIYERELASAYTQEWIHKGCKPAWWWRIHAWVINGKPEWEDKGSWLNFRDETLRMAQPLPLQFSISELSEAQELLSQLGGERD